MCYLGFTKHRILLHSPQFLHKCSFLNVYWFVINYNKTPRWKIERKQRKAEKVSSHNKSQDLRFFITDLINTSTLTKYYSLHLRNLEKVKAISAFCNLLVTDTCYTFVKVLQAKYKFTVFQVLKTCIPVTLKLFTSMSVVRKVLGLCYWTLNVR